MCRYLSAVRQRQGDVVELWRGKSLEVGRGLRLRMGLSPGKWYVFGGEPRLRPDWFLIVGAREGAVAVDQLRGPGPDNVPAEAIRTGPQ